MAAALSDTERFLSVGLTDKTVKGITASPAVSAALREVLDEGAVPAGGCDKAVGALLYLVSTRFVAGSKGAAHRARVAGYAGAGRIRQSAQVEAAFEYCRTHDVDEFSVEALEAACGVDVVVSRAEVDAAVGAAVAADRAAIEERRYRYPAGLLQAKVRGTLPFADGAMVKAAIDGAIEALLGPKTEADLAPPPKKKKEKKPKQAQGEAGAAGSSGGGGGGGGAGGKQAGEEAVPEPHFPAPSENTELNTKELLGKHLAATGGAVVTRFPPEPNGYLHIGHAKAMNLNFGFAKRKGGRCILRFDDTNPAAEKVEFIESIKRDVAWLGHEPAAVTHSSDYFDELYAFAVQLIKEGKAYVCHQTREEISLGREMRTASPWRERPVEESLRLFEDMRKGKYEEGKATLRVKIDMQSNNPNMRDFIAYRIIYKEHPHCGDKWCIYPSYDFTHCIVDALENITHSLCTLEFGDRRESYHWLLYALEIYRPLVWEYARLSLTHTVMSKRKLAQLVREGRVRGWDDPRLPTLCGLRRRGVRAAAINSFCEQIGVTRSLSVVHMQRLQQCIRLDMDAAASRRFAVLEPLKLVIDNFDGDEDVEALLFPKDPSKGVRRLPWRRVVYIERNDFRMEDSKDFFRLAPGKTVGLKYAYHVTCVGVTTNAAGEPVELHVRMEREHKNKVKAYIHWLASPELSDVVRGEARIYDDLFRAADLGEVGNWLDALNPQSESILRGALFEPSLAGAAPGTPFQFERVGFFTPDLDSTDKHLVMNRTVTLKEAKDMPV